MCTGLAAALCLFACAPAPAQPPTAFRVVSHEPGERYLAVSRDCSSSPRTFAGSDPAFTAGIEREMTFTKRLREGIRRGRIRCTVRIWTRPHVKVGGRYAMDEGFVVVDSIAPIALDDVTDDLARESGFESVEDLLGVARHGQGENVYLIRFHYVPPGGWDPRAV